MLQQRDTGQGRSVCARAGSVVIADDLTLIRGIAGRLTVNAGLTINRRIWRTIESTTGASDGASTVAP